MKPVSPFGSSVAVLWRWIQYPLVASIKPCILDPARHTLPSEVPLPSQPVSYMST